MNFRLGSIDMVIISISIPGKNKGRLSAGLDRFLGKEVDQKM